jgi:(heptosyl)LPS beta-1,4-glucosyltransferase
MKVYVVILTYNEAHHIRECIESVRFAAGVIVFDSFSSDETVTLAAVAGAEIVQRQFDNYANQRNAALELLRGRADWVLFVDADERVTPELASEVRAAMLNSEYAGWRIPRFNYIFGKLTKGAGWYPDYQTRLLRVGKAHYDPQRQVHELVLLDGLEGTLTQHFIHYNYRDLRQFIAKQRRYTLYDAQIMQQQGIHPQLHNFILQPCRHFWWRFVTLKGYQDGWHGLRLSLLMAWYELRKYQIVWRLWREKG